MLNLRSFFGLAAAMALTVGAGGCDWMKKKDPPGEKTEKQREAELKQRLRRACASEATYDRLKELLFDEAARIRKQDPRALDPLATAAGVRMENPIVKSRDEELDVTVCTGRFILELPPGAENAFDGERRLVADIEYSAQEAADGSGLVYQMDGAEPIIYRLATVGGLRPAYSPPASPAPSAATPVQVPSVPTPPPVPEARPQRETRQAASPSFNCNLARTRSERAVCASPGLSALDRRMSAMFYSALADAGPRTRSVLRQSRDRFLAFRERCPSDACIAQAYEDRMDEIRDIMAAD